MSQCEIAQQTVWDITIVPPHKYIHYIKDLPIHNIVHQFIKREPSQKATLANTRGKSKYITIKVKGKVNE